MHSRHHASISDVFFTLLKDCLRADRVDRVDRVDWADSQGRCEHRWALPSSLTAQIGWSTAPSPDAPSQDWELQREA